MFAKLAKGKLLCQQNLDSVTGANLPMSFLFDAQLFHKQIVDLLGQHTNLRGRQSLNEGLIVIVIRSATRTRAACFLRAQMDNSLSPIAGLGCTFIEPAVDLGDLPHPPFTIPMFHVKNRIGRPVKMVRNVGYLLVQAIQGVA
jgi:hypothetical protein